MKLFSQVINSQPKFQQTKDLIKFRRLMNTKKHLNGGIGNKGFQFFQILTGYGILFAFGYFLEEQIVFARSQDKDYNFSILLDNSQIHQSKLIKEQILQFVYSSIFS
ncbi:unnamed protein product [Paramecium octaurelia]|uniref:Transmembrane protein n=1 Tax=Paramecium octaurelia TaxID=43137 RepID=A0A8S1SVC9_PAROT|nr:unnamed protein product [Paramecium octaurelia]